MQNKTSPADFSRRSLLKTIGIGLAGAGFIGTGTAKETTDTSRYVVGTESRYGVDAVDQHADTVDTEIDFGDRGKAVVGEFSDDALATLEQRDDVRYVETEVTVEALGQKMPWGCTRVSADTAMHDDQTGQGAHVAVLDTGIDSSHPDLAPVLGEGHALVESETGDEPWDDDHSHGTHCAGTIAAVNNGQGVVGVAPDVTLHAVKALNSRGSGRAGDIADGIRWAANQGYDVLSMSIGATSSAAVIEDAVKYANDEGMLIVAAAGNEGCEGCVHYPAAYDDAMAVSSTNSDDELSTFSSTGPQVDIAAPGTDIPSTVKGGDYKTFSGTSMATPHVSAAGAILMANGASNTEACDRLEATAEDIGLGDNESGAGLLDVAAAAAGGSGSDSGGDDTPTVATTTASDVGQTSATLGGELTGLGDNESAKVGIEYWAAGDGRDSVTTLSIGSRTSKGGFTTTVEGLEAGTIYRFRAYAESGGDQVKGTAMTLTTEEALKPPVVETLTPEDVEDDEAELQGDLVSLGDAEEVTVGFTYWKEGQKEATATSVEARETDDPLEFHAEAAELQPTETYLVMATATTADGKTVEASQVTFTTPEESNGFLD
ncbi:MAG: S8 family serine peptidase [Haloarcula sp.]